MWAKRQLNLALLQWLRVDMDQVATCKERFAVDSLTTEWQSGLYVSAYSDREQSGSVQTVRVCLLR